MSKGNAFNCNDDDWFDRFVEHHISYRFDKRIMVGKAKHKEIHCDPLHPLYPEDPENIPSWRSWINFASGCDYRFEDDKGVHNCKYHDSSVGYCVPKLCPRK